MARAAPTIALISGGFGAESRPNALLSGIGLLREKPLGPGEPEKFVESLARWMPRLWRGSPPERLSSDFGLWQNTANPEKLMR